MPDFSKFGEVDSSGTAGHGDGAGHIAKGDPFAQVPTPFSYDYYDSVTVAAKFPKMHSVYKQYQEAGPHGPDQMAPKRKGEAGAAHPSHAGKDAKARSNKEDRT